MRRVVAGRRSPGPGVARRRGHHPVYKIIDVCKEVLATINNTQRWSAAGQQLLDGLKSAYQASSAA